MSDKVIMIVDDSATMRNMVSLTLNRCGYQIKEAEDGRAALEIPKSSKVDLVITVLNMPKMDGIELTRKLRAMLFPQKIPILLLTTELNPTKKAAGRAAGATGWITKPFFRNRLRTFVENALSN